MAKWRRKKLAIVLGAVVFIVCAAILSNLYLDPWLEHRRAMRLLAEYQANPCHETVAPVYDMLAQSRASQEDGDKILAELLKPKEVTSHLLKVGDHYRDPNDPDAQFYIDVVFARPEIGVYGLANSGIPTAQYLNQMAGRYSTFLAIEGSPPGELPQTIRRVWDNDDEPASMGIEVNPMWSMAFSMPQTLDQTLMRVGGFTVSKPGIYKGTLQLDMRFSFDWHHKRVGWLERVMRIVGMKNDPSEPREYHCSFKVPFEVRATEADWSTTKPAATERATTAPGEP